MIIIIIIVVVFFAGDDHRDDDRDDYDPHPLHTFIFTIGSCVSDPFTS